MSGNPTCRELAVAAGPLLLIGAAKGAPEAVTRSLFQECPTQYPTMPPMTLLIPAVTACFADYIVRTARNRALPSTTRWYAFGASASGYVSTIVLTFPCATKSRAS